MKAAIGALLLFAFSCLAVIQLSAQDQRKEPTVFRVRILDSHSRKPLKGERVQLTFTDMAGQFISNGLMITARTGIDGIASFSVSQPVPPTVGVFVWYAFPCDSPQAFPTSQIIESGVAATWHPSGYSKTDHWCSPNPGVAKPRTVPGEIVFYVHPENRFVWSWYDTFQ